MIELPEASALAESLNKHLLGKYITGVIANQSPHKFAWFNGDPQDYGDMLIGKNFSSARAYGGLVEVAFETSKVIFGDGVTLTLSDVLPQKHQLVLIFHDASHLIASVQMYGGMWCCTEDSPFKNEYYELAKAKPSPFSEKFDFEYFKGLIESPDIQSKSMKAFLATEQRIPGLGNGMLQEVLWHAGLHPKRKVSTLLEAEIVRLYEVIKQDTAQMKVLGGRDTEKQLTGAFGGYQTTMSKNGFKLPCPVCGGVIKKEAYLGGSIYYCGICQPL